MANPKKQHERPCAQCPFRRGSTPGWLGGLTPEEFRELAQSETRMACHVRAGHHVNYKHPDPTLPQCAGRAIYWANQCKQARDTSLLRLPSDPVTVFKWPKEFIEYHSCTVHRKPSESPT